jgi:hypothetical protein
MGLKKIKTIPLANLKRKPSVVVRSIIPALGRMGRRITSSKPAWAP